MEIPGIAEWPEKERARHNVEENSPPHCCGKNKFYPIQPDLEEHCLSIVFFEAAAIFSVFFYFSVKEW